MSKAVLEVSVDNISQLNNVGIYITLAIKFSDTAYADLTTSCIDSLKAVTDTQAFYSVQRIENCVEDALERSHPGKADTEAGMFGYQCSRRDSVLGNESLIVEIDTHVRIDIVGVLRRDCIYIIQDDMASLQQALKDKLYRLQSKVFAHCSYVIWKSHGGVNADD